MTQSQAQARRPGGAANFKTHLSEAQSTGPAPCRKYLNLAGPEWPLHDFLNRPDNGPTQPTSHSSLQRQHSDSESRINQVAGHIQPLKAGKHQNPVHGLSKQKLFFGIL